MIQASAARDAAHVFVVDDHRQARESIGDVLTAAGHEVRVFSSAQQALNALRDISPDVIITDLQMPGMNGLDLIRAMVAAGTDTQIVVITAHGTVTAAVEAMRLGAFDFIEKPFDVGQLESVVARALTHDGALRNQPQSTDGDSDLDRILIGRSAPMVRLKQQIRRLATVDETVLIVGESGTGKELVARGLHQLSARSQFPLVGLNCPALAPQLMESELFGHEKGAFTGADARRVGRFELAQGGTILLDEVTEIDLPLQAKLLRVLQEQVFERVGSSRSITADVRVLATTNRDLQEAVSAGEFREDLFFRLAVVPIDVPPLRSRGDDILLLAEHFLHAAAKRTQVRDLTLDSSAVELLLHYHWPGNVRELENLMKRITILCDRSLVTADDLRPWLLGAETPRGTTAIPVGLSLQQMERQLIEATLAHYEGHREKTAQALGIGVRTLTNKLRSYGYPPRASFREKKTQALEYSS